MALQKSITQPSGAVATYHKIITGTVDFLVGSTSITLASFLDDAARKAGMLPLATSGATFPTVPAFDSDPRIGAYDQLKANGWDDAKDV